MVSERPTPSRVDSLHAASNSFRHLGVPVGWTSALCRMLIASVLTVIPLATARSADNETRIGVSMVTLNNPYFKTMVDAMKAEAKNRGVSIVIADAQLDLVKQTAQVRDFLNQGCTAILMSPANPLSIGPVIQEANELKVPVFTVDIPCSDRDVKVVSHITTDNAQGGELAAQAMIEALGNDGGSVAVLGLQQVQACRLRAVGFQRALKKHNKESSASKIEVIANVNGRASRQGGLEATRTLLQEHPDLRGIFAINDASAIGAAFALELVGKQDAVTVIGFDGLAEGRRAVKSGRLYAEAIQRPELVGKAAIEAIAKHLANKDVPRTIRIPTELYRKADADKDESLKD